MNKLFQTARLNALYHWLELTGREILYNEDGNSIEEVVSSNIECEWQTKNWNLHEGTDKENNHISIICSLNNWASHITDILTDTSFDLLVLLPLPVGEKMKDENGKEFDFNMKPYEKLDRYYGRFFLVVSELILDFGDIAKKLGISDYNQFFSEDNKYDYSKVRGYINNVFKHKTNNFHSCNHHIPILFNDSLASREKYTSKENDYLIKIGCSHEYKLKDKNYIHSMPRLIDIIEFVGICYIKLDKLFNENNIIKLAEEYGDKY